MGKQRNPQSNDTRTSSRQRKGKGKGEAVTPKYGSGYDKIARTKANKARNLARAERQRIAKQAQRLRRKQMQHAAHTKHIETIAEHGGRLSMLPTPAAERLVLAWRSSVKR